MKVSLRFVERVSWACKFMLLACAASVLPILACVDKKTEPKMTVEPAPSLNNNGWALFDALVYWAVP